MRVQLGGRQVRVPEHFLHGAQVRPAFEQVRGERVAQRVRRDVLREPRLPRGALDDGPRSDARQRRAPGIEKQDAPALDRKSTRLNSSHGYISYAVFCLKKKKIIILRHYLS